GGVRKRQGAEGDARRHAPSFGTSWANGLGGELRDEARPRWGGYEGRPRLSAVEPRTSGPRAQVQEHYLVGTGTGVVVGSGRLTGFVRVVRRRPADVVLGVVLEPLRGGRGGDDRQVRRDVLRDRLERRGLLGGRL